MCTTCGMTLGGRVARALWSLADDLAETTRRRPPTGGAGRWGLGDPRRPEDDPTAMDPRVAAAALMLEVADADARFSPEERSMVACTLQEEFGLGPVQAERVVREARRFRDRAPGVWTFTNVLVEAFTTPQREILADILERLADADGQTTWHEDYAVRRICSLLRVEPAHV